MEDSKIRTITFNDKEVEDTLGALNLVIKSLDANQKETLKRYLALFEKIEK